MSLIPGQLCSDSLNILETKVTEHESTDGIARREWKHTGDQESFFTHIAQFSDSAESHCQLKLSNLYLSLNLILHFSFYSLSARPCFESASPKLGKLLFNSPLSILIPLPLLLIPPEQGSKSSEVVILNVHTASEHQPPFTNLYCISTYWKKHCEIMFPQGTQGMGSYTSKAARPCCRQPCSPDSCRRGQGPSSPAAFLTRWH